MRSTDALENSEWGREIGTCGDVVVVKQNEPNDASLTIRIRMHEESGTRTPRGQIRGFVAVQTHCFASYNGLLPNRYICQVRGQLQTIHLRKGNFVLDHRFMVIVRREDRSAATRYTRQVSEQLGHRPASPAVPNIIGSATKVGDGVSVQSHHVHTPLLLRLPLGYRHRSPVAVIGSITKRIK